MTHAVIDVTRLFTTEVTEFSARTRLRARGFDPTRSFIEKTKSFPTNIEVEVSQTYTSPPDATPAGGGGPLQHQLQIRLRRACAPEQTPQSSCTTVW